MTSTEPHAIVTAAKALIEGSAAAGLTARLLGGVAVALRCRSALPPSPLARSYSDLDIVVAKADRRALPKVLEGLGFQGSERFNAMNGHSRQLYGTADGLALDVFVERFKMCHEIDLKDRLRVDSKTLPLADLMLTKLQVANLTEKDVKDVVALLLDHEVTDGDEGISGARLAKVTGGDWGWWRTVTENLSKVDAHVDRLGLGSTEVEAARARSGRIIACIEQAPKSLRWKTRSRIGDRIPWREDPEDKP